MPGLQLLCSSLCGPLKKNLGDPWCRVWKEWWQHTPLSESNTNGERLWFNFAETDTNFWAGIQLTRWPATGGRRYWPSSQYSRNTPQSFSNLVVCFLEIDKTCVNLGILPRFLEKLLKRENLVCTAAMGIVQLWFNYFAASFSRYFAFTFSWRPRREPPVVDSLY